VPYTVAKQVPYNVTVKVPTQVTEMVPTTVTKRVPHTVSVDVAVQKPRYVPVPAATSAPCAPAANCDPCTAGVSAGIQSVVNDTSRPKPIRDFFKKLCGERLACHTTAPVVDPCANPCPPVVADPCK
jgi:hypothetical protein